jgi:hypothetical protein
MSASKDRPGSVHGRAGEACPVCGDEVRAVTTPRPSQLISVFDGPAEGASTTATDHDAPVPITCSVPWTGTHTDHGPSAKRPLL